MSLGGAGGVRRGDNIIVLHILGVSRVGVCVDAIMICQVGFSGNTSPDKSLFEVVHVSHHVYTALSNNLSITLCKQFQRKQLSEVTNNLFPVINQTPEQTKRTTVDAAGHDNMSLCTYKQPGFAVLP